MLVPQIGLLGKLNIFWESKKVLSVLYQQSGWLIQQFFFRVASVNLKSLPRSNNLRLFDDNLSFWSEIRVHGSIVEGRIILVQNPRIVFPQL